MADEPPVVASARWTVDCHSLMRTVNITDGVPNSRQGFTRGNTKSQQNLKAAYNGNPPALNTNQPPVPPLINSPSMASNYSNEAYSEHDHPKRFLNEKYAKCSVKGNFLTLTAQPKNVELGEWLAHQLVEMNRLLVGLIHVVQEVDTNTGLPVCNEHTCPTMSAGRLTYTWLEQGRPAKIPAPSYIVRVQKWIVGKIHDNNTFPTEPPSNYQTNTYMSGDNVTGVQTPSQQPIPAGPTNLSQSLTTLAGVQNEWIGKSSGFPAHYHSDVKSIVKQMFRCYAHLYHNHWDNPFWHINRHLELNSCFVHFMTVAMYYDLLPKKDIEPLQGLVDIFVSQGVIPKEAVALHTS